MLKSTSHANVTGLPSFFERVSCSSVSTHIFISLNVSARGYLAGCHGAASCPWTLCHSAVRQCNLQGHCDTLCGVAVLSMDVMPAHLMTCRRSLQYVAIALFVVHVLVMISGRGVK